MQEIESKIYTNNDLLNITQSTINLSSLNENINNIELALYMLDPVKDSHKYLCLSCIFGAFLGDSIGSCCEFSFESSDNHTHIFEYGFQMQQNRYKSHISKFTIMFYPIPPFI